MNHTNYVPILKWKMGEYQAMSRLKETVKDRIQPLVEIPPVGFDFETQQQKKSSDDHLKDFGKRLYSKWQARGCFVDVKHLPCETKMEGGQHYAEYIFEKAFGEGCKPTPVVCLSMDRACRASMRKVQRMSSLGTCLRLRSGDFDRNDFLGEVDRLLEGLQVGLSDTDLIIDLETPNFIPKGAYVRLVLSHLEMLPDYNRFRSFTIAATSYPTSIAALKPPFELLPRLEWTGYKAVIDAMTGRRLPAFADYAVAHPDLVELDMRLITPFAKLRYTIGDKWHVGRGSSVRKYGFDQYRDMCSTLIEQPYFDGPDFSAADRYIAECAEGSVPTGNLSTWVWVSTNRHISKVVWDLSRLHGPSRRRV